jgi:hypothetical protein
MSSWAAAAPQDTCRSSIARRCASRRGGPLRPARGALLEHAGLDDPGRRRPVPEQGRRSAAARRAPIARSYLDHLGVDEKQSSGRRRRGDGAQRDSLGGPTMFHGRRRLPALMLADIQLTERRRARERLGAAPQITRSISSRGSCRARPVPRGRGEGAHAGRARHVEAEQTSEVHKLSDTVIGVVGTPLAYACRSSSARARTSRPSMRSWTG